MQTISKKKIKVVVEKTFNLVQNDNTVDVKRLSVVFNVPDSLPVGYYTLVINGNGNDARCSTDNKESTITTSKIIYYPKQQLATTTHFITMQQPGIIVKSHGMNAYLNQQRVQLLRARGQYVKSN